MKIAVIAIGDELLCGYTVNSNAAFISRQLLEIGLPVASHLVIADETAAIQETLSAAISSYQLVICTGGLGPTLDDITRRSVASVLGCGLHYDQSVADHLIERLGENVATLKDQATIPTQAKPLHNRVGTAPGLLFRLPKCCLILLPGVPVEMEAMMAEQVIPFLCQEYAQMLLVERSTLYFSGIPEAMVDVELRRLEKRYPQVKIGIYPSLGLLTVRLASLSKEQLTAFHKELEATFGRFQLNLPGGSLAQAIYEECVARHLTLATAESCTGGAIASALTQGAGASRYFLGSIVAYSNAIKEAVLGVSLTTLEKEGAVSEKTVKEMLEGLFKITQSDLGITVSGIAGPTGGTPDKPVGTVCLAVGKRSGQQVIQTFHMKGNRSAIILRTTHYALANMLRLLTGKL